MRELLAEIDPAINCTQIQVEFPLRLRQTGDEDCHTSGRQLHEYIIVYASTTSSPGLDS